MNKLHYDGWGLDWLLKSDCNSARWLRSRGIYGTRKQVLAVLPNCACGWITTGGEGHIMHVRIYSIPKLQRIFPKQ